MIGVDLSVTLYRAMSFMLLGAINLVDVHFTAAFIVGLITGTLMKKSVQVEQRHGLQSAKFALHCATRRAKGEKTASR